METDMLYRILAALALIALIPACAAAPAHAAKGWVMGTPIVTYWAGPGGFMPVDDQTAAQLKSGGWNLGWAEKPEDLDVYHRHGLRAMLVIGTADPDDPAKAAALDALVRRVRSHPALYAYYIVDEPAASAFPLLGRISSFLRERDPEHLAYVNLFPTYANAGQLGVTDEAAAEGRAKSPEHFDGIDPADGTSMRYSEHLRQFIEIVKPGLISYDHYHFMKDGDRGQYFLNLALIRKAALRARKPFLNIIQACDSPAEGWRGPGEHELRWLTYTSLAYGAQGISHFRYDIGFWKNPKEPSTLLPLFWSVSRSNREFVAIAEELQPLTSLGAFHFGDVPQGAEGPPEDAVFAPSPRNQSILLGYFGPRGGRPTHAVAVNLDYGRPLATSILSTGRMQVFHAPTAAWSERSPSGRLKLELPPGGGALIRLAD